MDIPQEILDSAASRLWGLESHALLAASGFKTDWESQPRVVKKEYYRKVKTACAAVVGMSEDDAEKLSTGERKKIAKLLREQANRFENFWR